MNNQFIFMNKIHILTKKYLHKSKEFRKSN